MRKKILVFILVLAMLLPCVFIFAACNNVERKGNLNLTGGSRPHYDSLFSSESQSIIAAALEEGATLEQKSKATIALFDTANRSRKDTPVTLMLQDSNAGISAADVVMHGFNLRSGDKFYYQLVAEAKADDDFLTTLYSAIAGLAKVAYSKGDGDYWYTSVLGAVSKCDCKVETFPYATFDFTKQPDRYDAESFKETLHFIDSFHEVVNMEFCWEILKDVEITYNANERYYHVEFSVDMSADPQLIQKWYNMVKKDVEVSGFSIKKYDYYNAVLEVWDNGYAKLFSSQSSRDASLASGKPFDEFTFIWELDEIMELLKEDQSIPMFSSLNTVEDYIDYYSNPTVAKGKLSPELIGIIVMFVLIVVIIIGAIVAFITVKVLLKKGKLPKLAAWRDARKQKKLDKKATKNGGLPAAENVGHEEVTSSVEEGADEVGEDE